MYLSHLCNDYQIMCDDYQTMIQPFPLKETVLEFMGLGDVLAVTAMPWASLYTNMHVTCGRIHKVMVPEESDIVSFY